MKIFVTVGTTRFDSLVQYIAENEYFRTHECVLQVGSGGPHPDSFQVFDYTNQIDRFYAWADVIITHAGAGSIYRLLDMRKSLVIVPNTDRLDPHQSDIARFMHENGHALAVDSLPELTAFVEKAATMRFHPFEREAFFAVEDILNFIASEVN
ncbi:PssE/Cps14G family polysaccharide biosynthesis glycosyltransferase [Sphingosinicella xenopeptidilytica]|uniref:PssE/Cps14G family polysaccharide biosynthesis glycosyltransferase n=1 Tax=Sphingosinicella xenopeptidilytica TaxID=364098 RepID=A0ABW3C3A9_SPHXN